MFAGDNQKLKKQEQAVKFYQEETLQAKKQANFLKMELDKHVNLLQQRQREIEESNRINRLRESQYQLKE